MTETPNPVLITLLRARAAVLENHSIEPGTRVNVKYMRDAADAIEALEAENRELKDEEELHDKSFQLRWNADRRAVERWRAAGSGRELTNPDHADLVVWLLEQNDALEALLKDPVASQTRDRNLLGEVHYLYDAILQETNEGSGFWRACSGCHECPEGCDIGPASPIFGCSTGSGCGDCGGLGVVWDDMDYSGINTDD